MYVNVYSITLHSVTRIVFFFFLRLIWFCNFFRWFCGVIREFCTYLFQLTTVQFPNRNIEGRYYRYQIAAVQVQRVHPGIGKCCSEVTIKGHPAVATLFWVKCMYTCMSFHFTCIVFVVVYKKIVSRYILFMTIILSWYLILDAINGYLYIANLRWIGQPLLKSTFRSALQKLLYKYERLNYSFDTIYF